MKKPISSLIFPTITNSMRGRPYGKTIDDKDLEGLGGWLILVGVGILMAPMMALVKLGAIYSRMFSDGSWEALMKQGTDSYHPLWAPFLISEISLNIGFILTFLFVAYLFYTKKAKFPKWYRSVLILYPIFILIDAIAFKFILPNEAIIDPDTLKQLTLALTAMGWIPYLIVSRRVNVTFLNEDNSSIVDIPVSEDNIPLSSNLDKGIDATEFFDSWTEEYKILNEYDPIVAECHYELERIDHRLSRQFREAVVSDKKNAPDIKDRLLVEHQKEIASKILAEALAMAQRLGPKAEEEFNQVIEVMVEDLDFDIIIQRLEEKYGGNRSKVSDYEDNISYRGYAILKNKHSKYNVFKGNIQVKGSKDYISIKTAKAFINNLNPG